MNKFRKYIFLFCLINSLLFNGVKAQLMTNSNIGITISSTAQITVKGDIQNNASTTIANSGTIDLTGNWTNNAGNNNFGTSTGTVVLNGANQSVLGSSSTVFNNLTLQGSGTKTLGLNTTVGGGNASPAGVLNVGSVVLNLNSKTLSVTNSATNAVQSTTGYILSEATDNSSMVKWSINSTTGIHTVPFGNAAAVLIPLTYNLASGNAGDVSMSTYPSNAANLPMPTAPIAVTHIRDAGGANNSANMPDRYWEIDMTGSTAIANYTFTYAPAENASNGNTNTRIQHWYAPFAAWEAPLTGQLNPTAQSIYVPAASVSEIGRAHV